MRTFRLKEVPTFVAEIMCFGLQGNASCAARSLNARMKGDELRVSELVSRVNKVRPNGIA